MCLRNTDWVKGALHTGKTTARFKLHQDLEQATLMFGCLWWAGVKIDWEEAWGSCPGDGWWWWVMGDWWWWWVISDDDRWLIMVMGDGDEWCSIQSHMSFLSHFCEAIAFSDESEIHVTYLGILLHLCKKRPKCSKESLFCFWVLTLC